MEDSVVGLEPRLVRIESGVAALDARMGRVEQRLDQLDGKVDRLGERLGERMDGLGARVAVVEADTRNIKENLGNLEGAVRDLRNSLDVKFIWIVTTMIAFGSALLAAMAKGFHWLK